METEILQKILLEQEKTNTRLDKIDKRFEKVDERFDKIDERFEKVDERFEKIDERFNKVDERFEEVDNEFVSIHSDIEKMKKELSELSDLKNVTLRMEYDHGEKLAAILDYIKIDMEKHAMNEERMNLQSKKIFDNSMRINRLEKKYLVQK